MNTDEYEQERHKSRQRDDARKRGVKSPERAEAVMLAYASNTPGILDYMKRLAESAAQPERIQIPHSQTPALIAQPPEEEDGGDLRNLSGSAGAG